MVGHSLGGLIVRIFAHDYASEVAGVVLIESMNPKQVRESLSNSLARRFSFQSLLARVGVGRLLVKVPAIAPSLGPNQEAYYPLYIRPASLQTTANEYRALPASGAQAADVKSFGDLPLIVLTGRLHTDPDWQTWQTELLQLSTNSQQLFAENGNHVLQSEDPDAVVAAILKMVELVRSQNS